ncbi:MAG: helix-turn-helix domain-containing protein [Haloechinothrix sp.]
MPIEPANRRPCCGGSHLHAPPGGRVFSPGRLRGHRDRRELTRAQLAAAATVTPSAVTSFESGTVEPSTAELAALADALGITPAELRGRVDADDSWECWDVICAGMPPMSGEQIHTVATVLRRIQRRRHHDDGEHRPRAA